MTKISFFNGLKEIGGTFVAIETESTKCMFDFGFAVAGRMDAKIRKRKDDFAVDYIRLGMLTPADGIYDKYTASTVTVTVSPHLMPMPIRAISLSALTDLSPLVTVTVL